MSNSRPHIAVIGLGRFGFHLAETLTQAGADVIGVDNSQDIIEDARDHVTLAICLDSTDEEALRLHGLDEVDVAVVGIGSDFDAAILTVSLLRSLGVPRIIARAENDRRGQILAQVGADTVVLPEAEAAERWANRLMLPNLADMVELGEGHSLVQLRAPAAFHHKSPGELALRQKYHLTLVAIKRLVKTASGQNNRESEVYTITIPDHDTKILPNDIVILVGSDESINRLART
ncbi:MAG: Ktr system potassium uptake protein A [Phycisphaerae bacterium]|nr:Ktr system potassium uptake protein A [Phycisphaerae bacterium]